MATFIILANFTDQGIRNVKDSPARLEAFKQMAEKQGVAVRGAYYTVGAYDLVIIAEGNDVRIVHKVCANPTWVCLIRRSKPARNTN